MSDIFLQGEKIAFRPVSKDDYSLIYEWFNDPEVTYFMFTGQRPTSLEKVSEIMDTDLKSERNVIFTIIDKANNQAIGLCGLYEINNTAQKAEMRIIIGNKDSWGRGYGTESVEIINYYGFDRLNLHRIYLGVTGENIGAIKTYEKAGYLHEGVLKEDIYRNSRYYDSIRMGFLREYYYEIFFKDHQKKFAIK